MVEKDIGKIKKNETTDIVVRIDDFGGKVGLTIREFTTSDRYTGFTKSGTRIPLDSVNAFKQMISSIDESEMQKMQSEVPEQPAKEKKDKKTISDSKPAEKPNGSEEIKEEIF